MIAGAVSTDGTASFAEAPIVLRGTSLMVAVYRNKTMLAQLAFPGFDVVTNISVTMTGYKEASAVETKHGRLMTIEQIAIWVEGDGTDAMRIALADGIRAGLPAHLVE